jgi:hypothetical protein
MKKYFLKDLRKELSKLKNKNGINIFEYQWFPALDTKTIITLIKSDRNLVFENPVVKLIETYFLEEEYSNFENEIYNFKYITNLFKEQANTNILQIYKLIHDHETLNYIDISKLLEQLVKIKLDIKQVAHYCKELKILNLIKSDLNASNNNERLISIKDFSYSEKDDLNLPEGNLKDTTGCIEKISNPNELLDLTPNEELFLKNNDFIEKPVLDNRFTFLCDDNNIQNNILFHLALREKGLTLNQITLLVGMLGREKCIGRVLTYMTKEGSIKHKAMRDGKKYEYQYFINPDFEISKSLQFYVNYYKNFVPAQDLAVPIKIENNENEFQPNKKFSDLIELNENDYEFIIEIIRRNFQFKKVKEKYDLVDRSNKLNILLDFFNSISVCANKSFSNISFNRYLFCLNMINLKEILSAIDLKHLIVTQLENGKPTIDRKTLRKILANLSKLGLIQILEYEVIMKNKEYDYVKKKELSQTKSFAIRRDIEITENLREKLENELKTNKPKKLEKEEDFPVKEENIEKSPEKINKFTRDTLRLIEIVIKFEEKRNNRDMFRVFLFKLKKMTFIKEHLREIFNEQDKGDEIYLHEIIENKSFPKVIMPKYLTNKLLTKPVYNNYTSMQVDEPEDTLNTAKSFNTSSLINFTETIKVWNNNGLNELNETEYEFAQKTFKINEKDRLINPSIQNNPEDDLIYNKLTFLKKKRTRGKFEKKPELLNILNNIYFTPKITIKKLRNSFPSNHEACIDFLMYFKKQGFLNISRKNDNEISFQLNDSIKNYLKFT